MTSPASAPAKTPTTTPHRTIRPNTPTGRALRAIVCRARYRLRPARANSRSTLTRRVGTSARRSRSVNVPPLDLQAQARALGPALHDAVARVLADQQCVLGPHV